MRDNIFWRLYQIIVIFCALFLLYSNSSQLALDFLGFGEKQWEAFIILSFLIIFAEASYTPAREGDFITVSYPFVLVSLIGLGLPITSWVLWIVAFLAPIVSKRANPLVALTESSLKTVSLYPVNLVHKSMGGPAEDVYLRLACLLVCGVAYYICDRIIVSFEVAIKDGRLFKKNFWKSKWEESYMPYLLFLLGAMLMGAGYSTPFELPMFLLTGFFLVLAVLFVRYAGWNRVNTRGVLEAFTEVAEGRWMGMVGHGRRVGMLMDEITKIMDLPYEQRERLIYCAILHDIGIVDVPYDLLNYPTPEGEESEEFKRHAIRSAEIVAVIPTLDVVADCVRYHHKHPDGSGYPEGEIEEVPYCAYLVGACCDFDEMTCYKSYRERIAPAEALRIMEEGAGRIYDARAVELVKKAAKRLGRVR